MRSVEPDITESELIATLRARGQRVTPQRLALLRALSEIGRHATADELGRVAATHLPVLSLPTVYATLELFEELGLVRRVHAGGATLYDPQTDGHAHFSCTICGRVYDLDATARSASATDAARSGGHEPDGLDVVVTGRCAACAAAAQAS